MKKATFFIKKILKGIIRVLLGFVLLFALVAGLIQIPAIQNKIKNSVTSFVSSKTNTRIEIENIRISFPKSAVIEGLFLEDIQKDTLFFAGKIKANIAFLDLLSKKIHIKNFTLENAVLNAKRDVADSLFNFNFLLQSFSDSADQKKVKPKSKSVWTFKSDRLNLKNIRLHYDDKYGGTTLALALGNLELKMDVIDFSKSIYSIDEILVENLTAEVAIKNKGNKEKKISDRSLPIISANKIRINNSAFSYLNPDSKQSVITSIDKLNLNDGSVDLQKETVEVNIFYLSDSEISYVGKRPEADSLSISADPGITIKNNWIVNAKTIGLENNSFAYEVQDEPEIKNTFDANHLKFSNLSLTARDLHYSSESTEASIEKFTAIDKNNFAIEKFETVFSMDPHSVTAKKLKLKTKDSFIEADITLGYASLKSLRDSPELLTMDIEMDQISIKNSDILYFVPQLKKQIFFRDPSNTASISGTITGKLNNLKGENLFVETGVNTRVKTDFTITGLPDIKKSIFSFPLLSLNTSKHDIKMIAGSSIPKSIELPENMDLQVAFKGSLKDFESTVTMNSSFGKAKATASIDKNENFQSRVTITNFNVGSLLRNNEMFGPVSLTAEASGKGLDKNRVKAVIRLDASQIYLNKYTYHNLTADGNINGMEFNGKINLKDEYAEFDFTGLVNLNPENEAFVFQLNVPGANLQKLNFTSDDIRIALNAKADLQADSLNSINGTGGISNLVIAFGDKRYVLDSLLFVSFNEPKRSNLAFSSALFEVKYSGTVSPFDLSPELKHFINNYFPIADTSQLTAKNDSADFNFEIRLHNHPIFSQVLLPQLKEFEPGVIKGSYNALKKDLKLTAEVNKIIYGTTEVRDFLVDVKSDSVALNYKISSSKISNSQINFDNFLLEGKMEDSTLYASVSSIADNKNKKFFIRSKLARDNGNYRFALDPKDFYLMNKPWIIPDDNYIEFGKGGFLIHHFFIDNGVSAINIGSVNDIFNYDIQIAIKNFKLDDISGMIEKDTSLAKGILDGNVLLKRVNNSYGIIADAIINDLIVRDVPVGNITLKANNPSAGKFDIDLNLSGPDNKLTASGYLLPDSGNNSITLKASIESLSMKTIEAFSMGQISESSGKLSGELILQGNLRSPELTGELVFDEVFVKPAVLNSRLELKHETIRLKKEGIYFKNFTLSDEKQHTAIVDGSVRMKQFKDYVFDLSVNSNDFLLFNTTFKDNSNFFGRMIIDSKVSIIGPMALPVVNGRVIMKKGSNFTFAVPESRLTTDKGEDVLEFEDSLIHNSILYRDDKKVTKKSKFSGFDLSTIIEIDKEVSLRLLMDPSSSDSLVVKGEAALSFGIDRSGKMSLTGSYNLDEGSYLVSLESVIKRKFDIMPGSTIIWNGDPLDADVSINAKYTVRAAPYDLVAVQVSALSDAEKEGYKRQYPFWVLLKLRGEILHPVISFEIQLPPEEKGILGGAVNQKLNMLNEDASALNKQVFALLVLGRFVQENPLQTEAGGTSSIVRSTVGSFLSTQLNRLSSNLMPGSEINVDIQSYNEFQTGEAKGRTQVEIGIKKQLFNERLSVQVGGTVDVEGEKAKQNSASDITGDVTVEYKLTEDGRYRMKAFRHNQYEGAIEGQLIETGAGIVYVRDFNKWITFFKKPENKGRLLKRKERNNDSIDTK